MTIAIRIGDQAASRSTSRRLPLPRRDLVGPVEDFHPAVEMLDQRGAAFDPVAVVVICDAVDLAHFGGVDMPADHAVDAARAGRLRDDFLEAGR